MKNIIISLLCAASFFAAAIIASAQEVAQTQKVVLRTSYAPHVTNQYAEQTGVQGLRSIMAEQSLKIDREANSLAMHATLIPTITAKLDDIASGKVEYSTIPVVANVSTIQKTMMSLTVSFTKNPVGGILHVRGDIMPLFSGIVSSVRAKKSYEIIEASDELTIEQLNSALERVTNTLEEGKTVAAAE